MTLPGPDRTDGLSAPAATLPAVDIARDRWITRSELRLAGITIAVLAAVGAATGLGWAAWARTATRGLVYTKTAIIPDETEGFISSDGRFAVLTAVIGLAAGALIWQRRDQRGPVAVAGLGIGALIGALLTDLVGHLVGGGTTSGTVGTVLPRLPLQVHAYGFVLVEALFAVGCYVICAAFINPDDLGRPSAGSVRGGVELQQPGGHGDGSGAGQQDDLAPQ